MEDRNGWQIVNACSKQANGQAWSAFVARFEPALRRGVHRALQSVGFDGDRSDLAADLVQDCYCKILSRERRVLTMCRERDERALDAFFARLAERCTRDNLRARWTKKRGSRRKAVELGEIEHLAVQVSEPSAEERLLMKEKRRQLLATCRRAAGGRQRERNTKVLVLAFLEGLSSREIAARFAGHMSRTCIDSVVYRARQRLRKFGLVLGQRRATA